MNITMNSPSEWPFPSPVVPPGVTATGNSYSASPGGQVSVDPADVSSLLVLGFTLSVMGVIAQALDVPIGDQNGIDWPIPTIFGPSAGFVINDIIAVSANAVAATGGSLGILPGPNIGGLGLGSLSTSWNAAGQYVHWSAQSPPIVVSTSALYVDSRSVNGWTPADAGTVCNIYVTGYPVQ